MHGGIGRLLEFTKENRPKHRLERFRVVPLRICIVSCVGTEIEVGDEIDRRGRLVDDLCGLLGQRVPTA